MLGLVATGCAPTPRALTPAELPLAAASQGAPPPVALPVKATDPDLCPTAANPDKNEDSIGGLSSRSVLHYDSIPKIQNLYSRLDITLKVCTGSTLSSQDRNALSKLLNFVGVTNAKSFAAKLAITGDAQGGIKLPDLVPFSYSYDESKSSYTVGTVGSAETPWQVTSTWDIGYTYAANRSMAINTANLFKGIATTIAGAGSSTAILSPAANAYLAVGDSVLQRVATSFFTAVDNGSDQYKLDILAQRPERAIIYRFQDLSGRPLAGVKLSLQFTSTLANQYATNAANVASIDPTVDTIPVPQFSGLPPILSVSIGGPLAGTLQQAIAKETSYQNLLRATTSTSASSFAADCDALEGALQSVYGLNPYDTALTMAQFLAYNTAYLTSKTFYASGCFRNRPLLKSMGILAFETPPAS
jgi:hypothetical protein